MHDSLTKQHKMMDPENGLIIQNIHDAKPIENAVEKYIVPALSGDYTALLGSLLGGGLFGGIATLFLKKKGGQ